MSNSQRRKPVYNSKDGFVEFKWESIDENTYRTLHSSFSPRNAHHHDGQCL